MRPFLSHPPDHTPSTCMVKAPTSKKLRSAAQLLGASSTTTKVRVGGMPFFWRAGVGLILAEKRVARREYDPLPPRCG